VVESVIAVPFILLVAFVCLLLCSATQHKGNDAKNANKRSKCKARSHSYFFLSVHNKDNGLWAISRATLLSILREEAEKCGVRFHYGFQFISFDKSSNKAFFVSPPKVLPFLFFYFTSTLIFNSLSSSPSLSGSLYM
jgi:hypothetical protein